MKNLLKKLMILAIMPAMLFTSCVNDDFDVPDIVIPEVDFSSNISIANLKALYGGSGVDSLGSDTIIQGIVIANDESGNFYKTLVIQDGSAGIEVKINRTNMYTEFKVGQRVFIKCKGLYLGNYGTLVQLGYIYEGSVGQIPDAMVDGHVFRDSLPGACPTPTTLTIPTLTPNYLSMLIRIDSVHFVEAGSTFAETSATTNRTIEDNNGNQLALRTSNYADFASDILPSGQGSVVGVLSIYNGTYQFYIRDLNDLVDWDYGSATGQNLISELFTTSPTGWTIYSVAGGNNWTWNSNGYMNINGYNGDGACEDYLISPAINLTNVTDPILSFRTWTKYTDASIAQPLEVLISTDYIGSGDPSTSTWTALPATLPAAHSATWTGSGDIDLTSYIGSTVYVAFRYKCTSGTSASQWEVDEFKVKATM